MSSDIWNPWHGCRKYSEGCDHCYMYYLDNERGKSGGEIYKVKTNSDLSSSVYHTESHCKRAYVRRPQAAPFILPVILEASLCATDPVRGSRALRHNFC